MIIRKNQDYRFWEGIRIRIQVQQEAQNLSFSCFVELDALCGGIDAFCVALKSLKEGYEDIKSK